MNLTTTLIIDREIDQSIVPAEESIAVVVTAQLSTTIQNYISTALSLRANEDYYPPYGVAMMLLRHTNFTTLFGPVTKSKIINHLVLHNLVPLKKSSLYNLIKQCAQGLLHQDATWTEETQDGQKGYLTFYELNELILEIKQKTTGGVAFSTSEIRNEVNEKIRTLYQKKKKIHLLPTPIPFHTLNVYVSIIKAQDIFNIYGNVGNKT